jgi:DNA processing protein
MTANLATDQGRDVYAVPGPIYSPTSAGTNFLLSRGASPAISAEEIIESLGFIVGGTTAIPAKRQEFDSKEVNAILPLLSRQPIHIDELGRRAGLTAQEIATALCELEIAGRIHQIGGMYYILV